MPAQSHRPTTDDAEQARLARLDAVWRRAGASDLDAVAAWIAAETGFPIVTLERLDAERGRLVPVGVAGGVAGAPPGERRGAPLDECAAGVVVRTGRPVVASAPPGGEGIAEGSWVRTYLCLPLTLPSGDGPRTIGALTLADREERALDGVWVQRAATLARHLAGLLAARGG